MSACTLKLASAWVPIAMSLTALAIVLGTISLFGVVRDPDEGAAAHLFQLLMAGQLPFVAFFAIKWLPRDARHAVPILALQVAAVFAAFAPVCYFRL
jgi:hypothetical protein